MAIDTVRLLALLNKDVDDICGVDFVKEFTDGSPAEVNTLIEWLQNLIRSNGARPYVVFTAMNVMSSLSGRKSGASVAAICASFDIVLDVINQPNHFGTHHFALMCAGKLIGEIDDKDRLAKCKMAVMSIAHGSGSRATRTLANIILSEMK